MTQKEQVYLAMERNGGYATFQQLNRIVDTSDWRTKTPDATIRRIVHDNTEFFRLKPGLWELTSCKENVLQRFEIQQENATSICNLFNNF